MIPRFSILPGLVLAAAACAPQPPSDRETAGWPQGRLIDLTHPFDQQTLYWPTARPFHLEVESRGDTEAGYYYEANTFSAAEHGGTHLDAPIHFARDRWRADEIPLDRLIGPALVIDVSSAALENRDYLIGPPDLAGWEASHGELPAGVIVLLRTGYGRFWPDAEKYLGTARRGQEGVAELHFPGLSREAALWLADRKVSAVGIDTASIDYGQSQEFEAHRVLFEANVPAFENLAALDQLPEGEFTVLALPMKIAGGSGGPLRIVAVVQP